MKATPTAGMVRFDANGRVVIPEAVCRRYEIEAGTKASLVMTEDGILLKPITRAYIRHLRGKHRNLPLMETLAGDRQRERAH